MGDTETTASAINMRLPPADANNGERPLPMGGPCQKRGEGEVRLGEGRYLAGVAAGDGSGNSGEDCARLPV